MRQEPFELYFSTVMGTIVNNSLISGLTLPEVIHIMAVIFMTIPETLSRIRKDKGLSQQALADAIGLHVNQIKRYENGSSQPSLETLKKISKALRVSIDSLVFDAEDMGPSEVLRLQFEAIARMPEEEQAIILELLEGMIIKYETRRWATQRR